MKSRTPFKLLFILIILSSCARPPIAFQSSTEPVWKQIELKDGIDFEYAWKNVVDLISRRYDIEFMSKEDGYIRTAMVYYLSKYGNTYGVRISIKFDMDKRILAIQTYAQFHKEFGYDANILNDVYNDINGVLGRSIK